MDQSSLFCAVIRPNCLRACSVESSTISGNDFMPMSPQANSKAGGSWIGAPDPAALGAGRMFRSEGRAARGHGTGVDAYGTRSERKRFEVLSCLPTAPELPLHGNGGFGTPAFFGLLSDKPLLACIWLCGGSDVKNNGASRN
jgi:hypothetical protein